MRVQERMRAIRLFESAEKNKEYAAKLGIEARINSNKKNTENSGK